jgi:Family of unknown function (DUF5995)
MLAERIVEPQGGCTMAVDVAGVVERMEHQLHELQDTEDTRRFFLGTYLRTTQAVVAEIGAGTFEDPAWVARWDVHFAGLYLDALATHSTDPERTPATWRAAFTADPALPPEAHVLLGMNAHINVDLPQALIAVIPPEDFTDAELLSSRRRDHQRVDQILAARVSAEDAELQRQGGRRTPLDRLMSPANRWAGRTFLREARRTVWRNTAILHRARDDGAGCYERRVAELDVAGAARVQELLRPGPVFLRLAVHGFGVPLPEDPPPPWD